MHALLIIENTHKSQINHTTLENASILIVQSIHDELQNIFESCTI